MKKPIRVELPLAPRPWARARTGRGVFFKDPDSRKYQKDLVAALRASGQFPAWPTTSPLKLSLCFKLAPPKKKTREYPTGRPDLDNYIKAVMDALNGWVWKDDSQIVHVEACKLYDWTERRARIYLDIEPVEVT